MVRRRGAGRVELGGERAGEGAPRGRCTITGGAAILRLGLEFDLAPGWKIYWRSPGAAGYSPTID
jgi:suppressor for copper-sensitivity B